MNKTFLKVAFFSMLTLGAAGSFVGCKDYDGDINSLTEKDNTLQSQLEALKTALAKCDTDIAAAQQAAQTSSNSALQQAKAYADEAVAQAKADAIKDAIAQVNTLLNGYATQGDLNNVASQISAIDASLVTIKGDVSAATQAVEQMKIQLSAVENYKALVDANTALANSNKEEIEKLNGVVEKLNEAIEELKTSTPGTDVEDPSINDTLKDLANEIAAIKTNLVTLQTGALRSMVFIPNLYVDGVESVEYPYMPYRKLPVLPGAGSYTNYNDAHCVVPAVTNDNDQVEWNYDWTNRIFVTNYNPVVNIQYELNPSNAIINFDQLSFTKARDVEMVSRGVDAVEESHVLKPVESTFKIENGNLNIGFTTMGDAIVSKPEKTEAANSTEGTIFALQATLAQKDAENPESEEVVVTSDYAMLYPAIVTIENIGYPSNITPKTSDDCAETNLNLLWKTMEDVIEHDYSFEVQYNDTEGLDLTKLVDIHYNIKTLTKNNGHHVWNYGEEAAYGLHYDFALVQYTVGSNLTSDSKYAAIANDILYPRTVDNQGNTLDEIGIASVGREPIVRVRVLDEANNVVLVGFIKVRIVKSVETLTTTVFEKDVNFDACDPVSTSLTWSEISRELLDLTAANSKAEFDALYKLDVDNNGNAIQYSSNDRNATKVTSIGEIKENTDPSAGVGQVTNVLTWTLTNFDQQEVYEMNGHQKTVYIRYISRIGDADDTAIPMIYIPWTVTVIKPLAGTITEKSLAWWFNDNKDVIMNVPYPANGGVPAPFDRNQNDNWLNAQPVFSTVAGYPAVTPVQQPNAYKFYFTGNQMPGVTAGIANTHNIKGATCILNNPIAAPITSETMLTHLLYYNAGEFNNDKLYYGDVLIATLDQATGVIEYQNTPAAKEVLNKLGAAHRDVADASSLKANVGIVASTTCGYVIPMQDNIYDNYFLRPLTIAATQPGEFIDAQANGSWVRIADLLKFTDWRKVQFVDGDNYSNAWLLAYYQVKGVKVDIKNAVATTVNGNQTDNFWSMFPNAQFEVRTSKTSSTAAANNEVNFNLMAYNNASHGTVAAYEAMAEEMGYLFFQNTNGVMQETTIKVDITVSYYWGDITVKGVELIVKQTMGN